ncbi:MAG: hypothetical protein AAF615_04180 [Pseudomonadota bacterium]
MGHAAILAALTVAVGLALTPHSPMGIGHAVAQDEFADDCAPGIFDVGGTYRTRRGDDDRVTTAIIEFQCGDVLSDGTFIPTGYRVQLEGDCNGAPCEYPMLMANETAREAVYNASFVDEGKNVVVRLRKPRQGQGVTIIVIRRAPERGAEPDRAIYRLGPARS